ncbi:hypothetical protein A6E15_19305 [Natrinema saccharevitans]|uniref:Uncharacterized protein n=1 Tax=Natrinema saccharevitans TaxID=301967 RepID=A0A1S8AQI1_9EURY|nr:hypothetical protein [Natrinema saccharevitans]OLZ39113.1 hypothetical protein A6E15_19305 [Natrinema saccharevitans]
MSLETIGPHAESGFSPGDVLAEAQQGDRIDLEIQVYEGPFIDATGRVKSVEDDDGGIAEDPKQARTVAVDVRDVDVVGCGVPDRLELELSHDPNSAYAVVHDLEVLDIDGERTHYAIDDLANCVLERSPEWLPDEYDPDADLRERLPIMAEIDGGIELWVGDGRTAEIVNQPQELTEDGRGVYVLKAGTSFANWDYEIVVPKPENGDPFLRSVDPDQEYEDYLDSRTVELKDIDVRIYGVDHDRLEGASEVPA